MSEEDLHGAGSEARIVRLEKDLAQQGGLLEALTRLITEQGSALDEKLDEVSELLDRAAPAQDADSQVADQCTGWAQQADRAAWEGLVTWVDWLTETYDFVASEMYPCWPLHGGVVEELAALWMAWLHASSESASSGWGATEALAYWHDRYLPGTLQRIRHGWYQHEHCTRDRHESVRTTSQRTDRSVVVLRSTGEQVFDRHGQQAAS